MEDRIRLAEFGKQLKALERTLGFLNIEEDGEKRISLRSAVIHDFELSFELCWKSGQELAYLYYGIRLKGSRDVISYLDSEGYLADPDLINDMVEGRNLTVHTYGEAMAQRVVYQIENLYLPALVALYNALLRKS